MIKKVDDDSIISVTCSSIGKNHVDKDMENQDSIEYGKISENAWYIVVADGVSSAINAKAGSLAAVMCVREVIEELVDGKLDISDTDLIRKEYFQKWKSKFTDDWNSYATTVNFVMNINRKLVIGQIGDGLIVIQADKKALVLGEEEEFYSTETYALGECIRKSSFRIEMQTYEKSVDLYLTTDGIGKELAEESRIDLCQYMKKLVRRSEGEIQQELESWLHILDKKNGDDKSIGILTWEV